MLAQDMLELTGRTIWANTVGIVEVSGWVLMLAFVFGAVVGAAVTSLARRIAGR